MEEYMTLLWSSPRNPLLTCSGPPAALGLTTNHSTPARVFAEELTAVSRAAHSLPAAKTTCCMRVSLLSSAYSCSGANGSGAPNTKLVAHDFLFKQSMSGVSPAFCSERAGTTYRPTARLLCE